MGRSGQAAATACAELGTEKHGEGTETLLLQTELPQGKKAKQAQSRKGVRARRQEKSQEGRRRRHTCWGTCACSPGSGHPAVPACPGTQCRRRDNRRQSRWWPRGTPGSGARRTARTASPPPATDMERAGHGLRGTARLAQPLLLSSGPHPTGGAHGPWLSPWHSSCSTNPAEPGAQPSAGSKAWLCPRAAPSTGSVPACPRAPPARGALRALTWKLGRCRMRSQRGRTGRVRTKGVMPCAYSRLCLFMLRMCSLISFPGAPPRTLK